MRGWLATATAALAVVLIASVALAGGSNYKDSFVQANYTGSDGSLVWPSATPWTEVKDDGSHTSGKVQATSDSNCPDGNCLAIRSSALSLEGVGAWRAADLSVFEDATLKFKMNVDLGILPTDATLAVQGWNGTTWQTLDSYSLALNEGLSSPPPILLEADYLNDSFRLRYLISGLLDGDVYVDYVELVGTPKSTSTTTSTSSTSSTSTTSATTTTTLPVSTTLPTVITTTLPPLLTTTTTSSSTTSTEGATNTTDGSSNSTSTTAGSGGGDDDDGGSSGQTATTTTTSPEETSAREDESAVIPPVEPPEDPGLRQASVGLQVGYQDGRLGEIASAPELMGVAIDPSYTMAAEVFESSWVYLLALLLLVATAIVSGMDRRRLKRAKHNRVGLTHRTA